MKSGLRHLCHSTDRSQASVLLPPSHGNLRSLKAISNSWDATVSLALCGLGCWLKTFSLKFRTPRTGDAYTKTAISTKASRDFQGASTPKLHVANRVGVSEHRVVFFSSQLLAHRARAAPPKTSPKPARFRSRNKGLEFYQELY